MEKTASLQRANQQHRLVEWSRRVEACRNSGLPEQRAAGRSMVPGKWNSGIHLFLLAAEGNLCRGANRGVLPAVRAYRSSHGGKRCADPGLRGSG